MATPLAATPGQRYFVRANLADGSTYEGYFDHQPTNDEIAQQAAIEKQSGSNIETLPSHQKGVGAPVIAPKPPAPAGPESISAAPQKTLMQRIGDSMVPFGTMDDVRQWLYDTAKEKEARDQLRAQGVPTGPTNLYELGRGVTEMAAKPLIAAGMLTNPVGTAALVGSGLALQKAGEKALGSASEEFQPGTRELGGEVGGDIGMLLGSAVGEGAARAIPTVRTPFSPPVGPTRLPMDPEIAALYRNSGVPIPPSATPEGFSDAVQANTAKIIKDAAKAAARGETPEPTGPVDAQAVARQLRTQAGGKVPATKPPKAASASGPVQGMLQAAGIDPSVAKDVTNAAMHGWIVGRFPNILNPYTDYHAIKGASAIGRVISKIFRGGGEAGGTADLTAPARESVTAPLISGRVNPDGSITVNLPPEAAAQVLQPQGGKLTAQLPPEPQGLGAGTNVETPRTAAQPGTVPMAVSTNRTEPAAAPRPAAAPEPLSPITVAKLKGLGYEDSQIEAMDPLQASRIVGKAETDALLAENRPGFGARMSAPAPPPEPTPAVPDLGFKPPEGATQEDAVQAAMKAWDVPREQAITMLRRTNPSEAAPETPPPATPAPAAPTPEEKANLIKQTQDRLRALDEEREAERQRIAALIQGRSAGNSPPAAPEAPLETPAAPPPAPETPPAAENAPPSPDQNAQPNFKWENIDSTAFARVAYDPATQKLGLTDKKTGKTYVYTGITPDEFRGAMTKPADFKGDWSLGRELGHIRNRYKATGVPLEEPPAPETAPPAVEAPPPAAPAAPAKVKRATAKPGPAPTPPAELPGALRRTLETFQAGEKAPETAPAPPTAPPAAQEAAEPVPAKENAPAAPVEAKAAPPLGQTVADLVERARSAAKTGPEEGDHGMARVKLGQVIPYRPGQGSWSTTEVQEPLSRMVVGFDKDGDAILSKPFPTKSVPEPTDDTDTIGWRAYNSANPGKARSVGAAAAVAPAVGEGEETGAEETHYETSKVKGKWWRGLWGDDGPIGKTRNVAGEEGGRAVGAPPGVNTKESFLALKAKLRNMARQGEIARDWYLKSSQRILDMVGGDKDAAEKIAQLIGIFSPQNPVKPNFNAAIRAWQQYKAGAEEIHAGPKSWMDRTATDLLLHGKDWEGRKTNNFYGNLMQLIDPGNPAYKHMVTVDVHMMRSMGYGREAPGDQQYTWAENMVRDVAADLGWDPHEAQAAIWTAQKYRQEVLPKVKRGEPKPPVEDYNFSNAADELHGQVNMEAVPHPTSGDLPELATAPYETRMRYTTRVHSALHEGGVDQIAKLLGLTVGRTFRAPGYYAGELNPGMHAEVSMPLEPGGFMVTARNIGMGDWRASARTPPEEGLESVKEKGYWVDPDSKTIWVDKNRSEEQRNKLAMQGLDDASGGKALEESKRPRTLDPATRRLVEAYAAAYGYLMRQKGVGYGRPLPAKRLADANGLMIDLGRKATPEETQAIAERVHGLLGITGTADADDIFPKTTMKGIDVVNFSNQPNSAVVKAAAQAAKEVFGDKIRETGSIVEDGGQVVNDWEKNPGGEEHLRNVQAATGGSPEVQRGLERLRDSIVRLNQNFAREQGWGQAGQAGEAGPQAQEGVAAPVPKSLGAAAARDYEEPAQGGSAPSPKGVDRFQALADAQRGEPESAMNRAQDKLGGGVMSWAIEHAGDLTHRMSNLGPTLNYGREFMNEKVNALLRGLEHPYGFMREHNENMASNARYNKVDEAAYRSAADQALKTYADAHRQLPVFNEAQRVAQSIPIAIAEGRINAAVAALKTLKEHLKDPKDWAAYAGENGEGVAGTTAGQSLKEIGDTATVPADQILASKRSVEESAVDSRSGRGSRAKGPLEVWRLEDGRLLLIDGHHRFAEGIRSGKRNFEVKLIGEGYSDYYATPSKDNEFKVPKRAKGRE